MNKRNPMFSMGFNARHRWIDFKINVHSKRNPMFSMVYYYRLAAQLPSERSPSETWLMHTSTSTSTRRKILSCSANWKEPRKKRRESIRWIFFDFELFVFWYDAHKLFDGKAHWSKAIISFPFPSLLLPVRTLMNPLNL
jgi:hypothetical protein